MTIANHQIYCTKLASKIQTRLAEYKSQHSREDTGPLNGIHIVTKLGKKDLCTPSRGIAETNKHPNRVVEAEEE